MKLNAKSVWVSLFLVATMACLSQVNPLDISPEKEKYFTPYMYHRHGGPQGVAEFKETNKHLYLKELWYYSSSFYIKRDYLPQGDALNEFVIDISRYESSRKTSEEAILLLPGAKDALILLPADKLIYKP